MGETQKFAIGQRVMVANWPMPGTVVGYDADDWWAVGCRHVVRPDGYEIDVNCADAFIHPLDAPLLAQEGERP